MIERIKQEIERRISDNTFGAKLELIDLLFFIESLEKEPKGKTNPLFEDCLAEVNPDVRMEVRENIDKTLEKEQDAPKIKGWVARDKSGDLYFFHYDCKPHRTDGIFHSECSEDVFHLDNSMFSEIDWLTEPIKVELTILQV